MKWDKTQQWIDNSKKLLSIILGECCKISCSEDGQVIAYNKVGFGYRKAAYECLCNMNPADVAGELESYLTCNNKQDMKVFNVWADKLNKGLRGLSALGNILQSELVFKYIAFNGWEHRILEKESVSDFLFLTAYTLYDRLWKLQSMVESITESYDLTNETVFITLLMRDNLPKSSEKKIESRNRSAKSIYDIIQCEDKEGFVKNLHILIDGKRGKRVAAVFVKAKMDSIITDYPTQMMLSDFNIRGSWWGIAKYMNEYSFNDNKILVAASAIIWPIPLGLSNSTK